MNSFSRHWKLNGARHRNTAAGRATSISTSATTTAPAERIDEPVRPGEQAEQHEHHDLRQPRDGVEEHDDRIARAGLLVADDEAGEIDGEEARRVHGVAEGEQHDRADGDEGRVQALRQVHAVEHPDDELAAGVAEQGAERRVAQRA